jgi:hypothetical protein
MNMPLGRILTSLGESNVLSLNTAKDYRMAGTVVAVVVISCSLALLISGASPQAQFAWDTSAALDVTWRVYNGDRPHVDFFSPHGALHLALLAATMAVAGRTADVLAHMPALLMIPVASIAWYLARRRLPAIPAAFFSILTALLLAGTFWLSGGTRGLTYAMQYNRVGWVGLLLVALYWLLERDPTRTKEREFLDDALGGAVLGLMAFGKLNYLVVCFTMALVGFGLYRHRARRLPGQLIGLVIALVPMLLFVEFRADRVVADAWQLLSTASGQVSTMARVVGILRSDLFAAVMVASGLFLTLGRSINSGDQRRAIQLVLVTGAIVVGGVVACLGNMQVGSVPTFALAALIIAEMSRRRYGPDGTTVGLSALAILLTIPFALRDGASVAYTAALNAVDETGSLPSARIQTESMRPLLYPLERGESRDNTVEAIFADSQKEFMTSNQYAAWVNDGLELLRPFVSTSTRVMTIDLVNPFPFSLRLPQPRRNVFFWNSLLWDSRYRPPVDSILGTSDLVMIPKRSIAVRKQREFLAGTFCPTIDRDFVLAAESRLWQLMQRRPGSPSTKDSVDLAPCHAILLR